MRLESSGVYGLFSALWIDIGKAESLGAGLLKLSKYAEYAA